MGNVWFDGNVPVFHVKFHTKVALSKLLAGQSEVEKKLMTKLQSRLQPLYGHATKHFMITVAIYPSGHISA